jgi:benzylsuccinate CoA-transferase BbsF subunit
MSPHRSASAPESASPLAGLRVLEFAQGVSVPWLTRHFVDHGAEVIRIETHTHPDSSRLYVPPHGPDRSIDPTGSPWLAEMSHGKRSITLNLKAEGARELALRLVAISDVVACNFRAGALDRLGLGYEQMRAVNPSIVVLNTTGYGYGGPYHGYLAWGPNIDAMAGFSPLTGYPDRPPANVRMPYADFLGALHGLYALLCALRYRRETGEGQFIDCSMLETLAVAMGSVLLDQFANGRPPARQGNQQPHLAPQGVYACQPDPPAGEPGWLAVSVSDETAWQALCRVIEAPDLAARPDLATVAGRQAAAAELDARIAAWTAQHTKQAAMEKLQAAGVAAGAVQHAIDLLDDPQLSARGFFPTVEHPRRGAMRITGLGVKLGPMDPQRAWTGRPVGEANDAVFRELLGLEAEEIAHLQDTGAIEPVGTPGAGGANPPA